MGNKKGFVLNESGYFENGGVNVMAFDDFYPSGHQSGIVLIMNGDRVASNGDIRFEPTPGQWQPVPKQLERNVYSEEQKIVAKLRYPDTEGHLKGFNPMIYPDFEFEYEVSAKAEGDCIVVRADLDRPIPEKYVGKLCFNLELFPGTLFGKPWIMDDNQGIFPMQPNGPVAKRESNRDNVGDYNNAEAHGDLKALQGEMGSYSPIVADDLLGEPYAVGKCFTARPEDPYKCFTVESMTGDIKLYDGRMNHNNGWFVLSMELLPGKTAGAVEFCIRPNVVEDWIYKPVVQVSQVGYHPAQSKIAIIELDKKEKPLEKAGIYEITAKGKILREEAPAVFWGDFLRYQYLAVDFSHIKKQGLYQICYKDSASAIFRIAEDVYDRGVWQPVLEYFLPVQMCHMRVNEKYRVWHGLCHDDDARMAPVNLNHFDGYFQGPSTLTKYKPGEYVPGLNKGGWHDAGDFDLRIESQAGEAYILASIFEEFGLYYDATTIDQDKKLVEIHQPDGKNDLLQQVEHGLLTVVGGYKALGRLYRGIICKDLRQYVLLGDASTMTKGTAESDDARWVFTEDNPGRELSVAAQLACCSRAMKGYNDELAADALNIAKELYAKTEGKDGYAKGSKIRAATELFISTGEEQYKQYFLNAAEDIIGGIEWGGYEIVKVLPLIPEETEFIQKMREAFEKYSVKMKEACKENPYGIPYHPVIWGAGWGIERMGCQFYALHKAYPDLFEKDMVYRALDFMLGCHPGANTSSFASGVGARSATVAYGANRADWSYIPGGVVSGTALIRPDLPELLEFPFLWQQMEYVLGGGSSNFLYLVLAVQKLLKEK